MQMYPRGGYPVYEYDEREDEVYFCMDDYHYNNQFTPQSMQMRPDQYIPPPKQKGTGDYFYKDDYHHYKNGSSMQMKPDQWIPPQKHNYNHVRVYGGYDQNNDNFKHGRENYKAQFSEAWYEKEQQNDTWFQYEKEQHNDTWPQYEKEQHNDTWPQFEKEQHNNTWNNKNGYPGHGKHQNANKYSGSMSHDVEMSSGYGAHQGSRIPNDEHRPYYSEQNKAPPVWRPKGIVD